MRWNHPPDDILGVLHTFNFLREVNYTFLDSAKTLNIEFLCMFIYWASHFDANSGDFDRITKQQRIKNKPGFSREAYTWLLSTNNF